MLLRRIVRIRDHLAFSNLRYMRISPLVIRRISCWKCGTDHKDGLYCLQCKSIQDHTKVNYFELMGLDVSYDVNVKKLVSCYHKLQVQFHPDKHSNDTEEEKQKSVNFSTLVNKAYSTLINPTERGSYILRLNNLPIEEDSTCDKNPELLSLLIHYNDEIADLSGLRQTKKLSTKIQLELKKLSEQLSQAFAKEDYQKAKDIVIKMKYYGNLLQKVKQKMGIFGEKGA